MKNLSSNQEMEIVGFITDKIIENNPHLQWSEDKIDLLASQYWFLDGMDGFIQSLETND